MAEKIKCRHCGKTAELPPGWDYLYCDCGRKIYDIRPHSGYEEWTD